jgi:glycosyltransferase involved in cell wall biosynthesis
VPSALVSILLPVRDAAPTLGTALRSVQRQRETRWECIAVDDGSTDATPEILCDARARAASLGLVDGRDFVCAA